LAAVLSFVRPRQRGCSRSFCSYSAACPGDIPFFTVVLDFQFLQSGMVAPPFNAIEPYIYLYCEYSQNWN
jgi:hypothetical protein